MTDMDTFTDLHEPLLRGKCPQSYKSRRSPDGSPGAWLVGRCRAHQDGHTARDQADNPLEPIMMTVDGNGIEREKATILLTRR